MDALVAAYERFAGLPWDANLAPAQRVWMVVYPPRDERRLRARITAFEIATAKAGHPWHLADVTDAFAAWLGAHPYRETYFKQPELLSAAAIKDFEGRLAAQILDTVGEAVDDVNAVVAILGVGSLFPFTRVSRLIETVAPHVSGRLVVFFPGERDGSNYRLLEARDGWNYLATPISASEEAV
jgi:hypothetical protein